MYLRKRSTDMISSANRLSIIIGAVFGALLMSRGVAFLENPIVSQKEHWMAIFNNKTIMGGLFGGLLGVELVKRIIGEKRSSGDLFTFPIILGIIIGRIGCFLAGTNEFAFGKTTSFFMGMDLGDGLPRHPIALYEIFFLILLFWILRRVQKQALLPVSGDLFKAFMLSYFGFRFFIEFLKPNTFTVFGLSSIQYLCVLCWGYYMRSIFRGIAYARKKLHLL